MKMLLEGKRGVDLKGWVSDEFDAAIEVHLAEKYLKWVQGQQMNSIIQSCFEDQNDRKSEPKERTAFFHALELELKMEDTDAWNKLHGCIICT